MASKINSTLTNATLYCGNSDEWGIPISGNIYFSYTLPEHVNIPVPKRVIYNGRTTVVIWSDKSKTIVRCMPEDAYNREQAVATAIAERLFKTKAEFKRLVRSGNVQKTVEEEDYEEFLKEQDALNKTEAEMFKNSRRRGL